MSRTVSLAAVLLAALLVFSGCARETDVSQDDDLLSVFVTIAPMKYITEQIGGDFVMVETLVSQGADPHTFEPSAGQMVSLSGADLYFSEGLNFEEAFMGTLESELPDLVIVDTSSGAETIEMEEHDEHEGDDHDDHEGEDLDNHEGEDHDDHEGEDHVDHEGEDHDEHEEEDHHRHEGPDPHVWMGPSRTLIMAANIRDALVGTYPEQADAFRANYEAFADEVAALDEETSELLAHYAGRSFVVAHPSYGYFANDYDLRQVAVETDGKEPTPRQLERLIEEAREEGSRIILVQPQFPRDSAQLLADAIDGTVTEVDHLAEDWPGSLREIAVALEEGFR